MMEKNILGVILQLHHLALLNHLMVIGTGMYMNIQPANRMQYILMKYPIYTNRTHNKSLHPIWSVGPAFASCSWGAANAAPPAQTGELNRYICRQWPHFTQGRPLHRKPIGQSVAGPSRATCKIMTSAGRPALMPFFYGWMYAAN